jgi:outer membrane protease
MYWLHAWANILPYHYNMNNEYSYHEYIDGQWTDYSGGMIFGYKYNKNLGLFAEGKYNKYWNREWYDFKVGINYILL